NSARWSGISRPLEHGVGWVLVCLHLGYSDAEVDFAAEPVSDLKWPQDSVDALPGGIIDSDGLVVGGAVAERCCWIIGFEPGDAVHDVVGFVDQIGYIALVAGMTRGMRVAGIVGDLGAVEYDRIAQVLSGAAGAGRPVIFLGRASLGVAAASIAGDE